MIIPILIFLCWGSFLNVIAHRLISGDFLFSRSRCPHCHTYLAWYDLIPVISWFSLHGRCRYCKNSISILYPFVELITAITCTVFLYYTPPAYFVSYFLFITTLIIVIRTDLEHMLIPRVCSLYLIPVGIVLSVFQQLPITPINSFLGAFFGYCSLAVIAYAYKKSTGITGMGDGDPELLGGIGSFVGITGVLHTLLISSLTATIYALFLIMLHRTNSKTKIPFGPFLALGGIGTALHTCISPLF
jgi:leader peptidase (prepilin peptidase) / N-methyltransferase